ncbi:hypothetical protein WJX81_005844 [Elliptochloris bilobata]|uniref:Tryptophan synthase beta chain-like PALP domain-containing protein n=1 Tax=Elliptochloris bilobata TaxID=381761 RepID=A0AAW1RII0_9CHLO
MENYPEQIRRNGWFLPDKGLHPLAEEAVEASKRIYAGVHKTRLLPSAWLSQNSSGKVLLKLESEQVTGSFKARGAMNKVLSLSQEQLSAGLVTCSTGNHALAFLNACSRLDNKDSGRPDAAPLVYLPENASAGKAAKLAALGARLVRVGGDAVEAEIAARSEAERLGAIYVSPYNDPAVAGGQGTIALELLAEIDHLDAVFVPVGGGGMISGIAAVLKEAAPAVHIVGCQPSASDVMRRSVDAGRIVEHPSLPTLSDGTAGGVEEGAITLEPCMRLVDEPHA